MPTRSSLQAVFCAVLSICWVTASLAQAPGGQTRGQGSIGPVPEHPTATDFLSPPQQVAIQCAKQMHQHVGPVSFEDARAFVKCSGGNLILTAKDHAYIECGVSSSTKQEFADCAAMTSGIRLSDEERILSACAFKSHGDQSVFATCVGPGLISGQLTPTQRALVACATSASGGSSTFVACTATTLMGTNFNREQKVAIECAVASKTKEEFASCVATSGAIRMSEEQRILVRCAFKSNGDRDAYLSCVGTGFVTRQLTPKQRALVACGGSDGGSSSKFASCMANTLMGPNVSQEQRVAIECAADTNGDATGFATCAGTKFLELNLNPEQQIAVECVVASAGVIYATAACIATRLVMRELEKCLAGGWGGSTGGCFGDTNDVFGKNGWLARSFKDIAGGPHSVIHDPAQLFGGPHSAFRDPISLAGGPNSVIRNPSQLVQPIPLGSVGGRRVCFPAWC